MHAQYGVHLTIDVGELETILGATVSIKSYYVEVFVSFACKSEFSYGGGEGYVANANQGREQPNLSHEITFPFSSWKLFSSGVCLCAPASKKLPLVLGLLCL